MSSVNAYSFADTHVTLIGPGGVLQLGAGSGSAEEGITISSPDEIDAMTAGADGKVMHSLIASRVAKIVFRFQKTSPINAKLNAMQLLQRTSALYHAKNVITLVNAISGDGYTATGCAFARVPENTWAKQGGTLEWEFNVSVLEPVIGPNTL